MTLPTFPRIENVDYSDVASIRANKEAKDQLAAVMKTQYCEGNLEFLDEMELLAKEDRTINRWDRFSTTYPKWIAATSKKQINLSDETRKAFASAHAACKADGANAAATIGFETQFDKVLEDAANQMKRMLPESLNLLNRHLSPELNTP